MFKEPKNWKDWGILLTAWLSILALGIKGIFNVDITPHVGDIVNFVLLTVFIAISLYGVYKNTYAVTKKAKRQDKALKQRGLK